MYIDCGIPVYHLIVLKENDTILLAVPQRGYRIMPQMVKYKYIIHIHIKIGRGIHVASKNWRGQ
jgi:hypothetical protein